MRKERRGILQEDGKECETGENRGGGGGGGRNMKKGKPSAIMLASSPLRFPQIRSPVTKGPPTNPPGGREGW
jgi:hypothetical protein